MFATTWCKEHAVLPTRRTWFAILVGLATFLFLVGRDFFHPLFAEDGSTQATISSPNGPSKDVVLSAARKGDWFIVETRNFRLWSRLNTAESLECARRCEALREQLRAKWVPQCPADPWTPKAEVVVHRNMDEFLTTTGTSGTGASGRVTVKQEQGRVLQRRIDLRADVSGWSTSSLPHEMTHLIIVDHFGGRKIPRWADEGMAVLAESREKQAERAKTGAGPELISLSQMVCNDLYPAESQRAAFYARSASLTEYLVSLGGSETFLKFIELTMDHGYDRALKETYRINDVSELDLKWNVRSRHATPRNSTLATR